MLAPPVPAFVPAAPASGLELSDAQCLQRLNLTPEKFKELISTWKLNLKTEERFPCIPVGMPVATIKPRSGNGFNVCATAALVTQGKISPLHLRPTNVPGELCYTPQGSEADRVVLDFFEDNCKQVLNGKIASGDIKESCSAGERVLKKTSESSTGWKVFQYALMAGGAVASLAGLFAAGYGFAWGQDKFQERKQRKLDRLQQRPPQGPQGPQPPPRSPFARPPVAPPPPPVVPPPPPPPGSGPGTPPPGTGTGTPPNGGGSDSGPTTGNPGGGGNSSRVITAPDPKVVAPVTVSAALLAAGAFLLKRNPLVVAASAFIGAALCSGKSLDGSGRPMMQCGDGSDMPGVI